MVRVKYSFFLKKDIQRTNILHLSNSKTPSKGKRYLLTSYNVDDVTECAPRDDNGIYREPSRILFSFHNITNASIVFFSQ